MFRQIFLIFLLLQLSFFLVPTSRTCFGFIDFHMFHIHKKLRRPLLQQLFSKVALVSIGAKPNLYCKAIELVCGGSPKICVLREEIPTRIKVGGLAAKTSLDQLFVQYKCTVMDEINRQYLQLQ